MVASLCRRVSVGVYILAVYLHDVLFGCVRHGWGGCCPSRDDRGLWWVLSWRKNHRGRGVGAVLWAGKLATFQPELRSALPVRQFSIWGLYGWGGGLVAVLRARPYMGGGGGCPCG